MSTSHDISISIRRKRSRSSIARNQATSSSKPGKRAKLEEEEQSLEQLLEAEMNNNESTIPTPSTETSTATSLSTSTCVLSSLPPDLITRIFSYLSVPSLCRVSCVSHMLGVLSCDGPLWADHFVKRWHATTTRENMDTVWKHVYIQQHQQDMEDMIRTCAGTTTTSTTKTTPADTELDQYFQSYAKARITMALHHPKHNTRKRNEFEIIEAWRVSHPDIQLIQDQDHTCTQGSCHFDRDGDIWICQQSGSVHFCGTSCEHLREVRASHSSHALMCPITGEWAHDYRVEYDEREEGDGEDGEEEKNTLAACFERGYAMGDEYGRRKSMLIR